MTTAVLPATKTTPDELLARYRSVRAFTEELCEPLAPEDYVVQSMTDASPTKWHICHVSWFFEQFVLEEHVRDYSSPDPRFAYLFNSYYIQAGPRYARPSRGLISRPTVEEAYEYRSHVDRAVEEFIGQVDDELFAELAPIIELGLNHEQQHQELILTDLKHMLSHNPLNPVYRERKPVGSAGRVSPLEWTAFSEGVYEIGHDGDGFAYDNECPRHRVFLEPFELASRPITNGEYLEFMGDGGYQRPELWLSDGWATVQREGWDSPLYWRRQDDGWWQFTMSGLRPVERAEPACHLSYYEADAFARWAGARLPTEAEWEVASRDVRIEGNFVDEGHHHPIPVRAADTGLCQMFGDVWEWTLSHYSPYPGYQPPAGAVGEYNGKFMCNQFVLRGGACTTSSDHIRRTYRNFLYPHMRWFFSGARLARESG